MRMRIGKRVRGRFADDHARLAAYVTWHSHMTGNVVVAHAHAVAGPEMLAFDRVRSSRRARCGQRKSSSRTLLELGVRQDTLLDEQGREAGQRPLVVARGEIVARLHPLDGVPVLVHVEDAAANG